jgi:hypothetical protein
MQFTKPAPPPGRPSIDQRISAIKLAARSHTSSSNSSKKIPVGGQELVLPADVPSLFSIPTMVICYENNDDDDDDKSVTEDRICEKTRPRFMRWKSTNKYKKKEEMGEEEEE